MMYGFSKYHGAGNDFRMMKPVSSLKNNMAIVLGYSQISGE